ncbi:MAG: transposase [Solirubrobacterales bacterium]
MLRMQGPQAECLWDEVLPPEVRELPADLARIDELLSDPALLEPIAQHWRSEAVERGRNASAHGRPTIAMASYVRLMVVKHRSGWGYETLVKEVSDSLHLRRFCLLAIDARVPDESTVRKLTRRLGAQTVAEIIRAVIAKAARERRFAPRAARIDSTVIEADVRYPSDAMLALQGARALARQGQRLGERLARSQNAVRDRSRAIGRRVRQISRTLGRRSGEARAQVIELNRQAGALLRSSAREARRLASAARVAARGRGARAKLRAAEKIEQLAERCERVAAQTLKRARGQKIEDRIVSLSDPEARPIRKGKAGKPTEFGYVAQICELTPSTKPGARGLIVPAASALGNPGENTLLPETVAEIEGLGLRPKEVALDGGFGHLKSDRQLACLEPERVFVSGRRESGSRRTKRRLRRYRTGTEGRISHLKRGYGLKRSRLKGHEGGQIWTGWGILAYDLDTVAVWER